MPVVVGDGVRVDFPVLFGHFLGDGRDAVAALALDMLKLNVDIAALHCGVGGWGARGVILYH